VNNGYVMPAWYDIFEMTLDRKVDEKQLRASAEKVHALIDREIERGVPSHKIVLAGFSQGGAVAYEAALTYEKPLGGLLTLSTYYATHQTIKVNSANKNIPIMIQHGTQDSVVNEALGKNAYRILKENGYSVSYETYPMAHTLCAAQIKSISVWLEARLK
ncbi:MAG: carboxylesterase, partial [Moraxellaceae bacterium]